MIRYKSQFVQQFVYQSSNVRFLIPQLDHRRNRLLYGIFEEFRRHIAEPIVDIQTDAENGVLRSGRFDQNTANFFFIYVHIVRQMHFEFKLRQISVQNIDDRLGDRCRKCGELIASNKFRRQFKAERHQYGTFAAPPSFVPATPSCCLPLCCDQTGQLRLDLLTQEFLNSIIRRGNLVVMFERLDR